MTPLDLVRLRPLMARTSGTSGMGIGLIDGPVAINHPGLASQSVRTLVGNSGGTCSLLSSAACSHGTFVAGILSARRGGAAPAICPKCTLLVRPIFSEAGGLRGETPTAKPEELAQAILDCIHAGARVLNISASVVQPSARNERVLVDALDRAALHRVIVVVAAGNQRALNSSVITRHPWVIPVIACDLSRQPGSDTNLGNSIGKTGLGAPGEGITSLGATGSTVTLSGTSAAAPFVAGAVALLWSEFPGRTAAQIKFAVAQASGARRTTIVPPLLDAEAAYQSLLGRPRAHWQ